MRVDDDSELCPCCGYFTYETTQCVPKSVRIKNAAISAAKVIRMVFWPLNLTGPRIFSGFPPSAIADSFKLAKHLGIAVTTSEPRIFESIRFSLKINRFLFCSTKKIPIRDGLAFCVRLPWIA